MRKELIQTDAKERFREVQEITEKYLLKMGLDPMYAYERGQSDAIWLEVLHDAVLVAIIFNELGRDGIDPFRDAGTMYDAVRVVIEHCDRVEGADIIRVMLFDLLEIIRQEQ